MPSLHRGPGPEWDGQRSGILILNSIRRNTTEVTENFSPILLIPPVSERAGCDDCDECAKKDSASYAQEDEFPRSKPPPAGKAGFWR